MKVKLMPKTNCHVEYALGKIAYRNPRIRANLAVVKVGFTYIGHNEESYFSITGEIWNNLGTDCLCAGAGVHKELRDKYFRDDPLLNRIVALGRLCLKRFSRISDDDMAEIIAVMNEMERRKVA